MIRAFDQLSLPLLRWLDAEDAHRLAIQGLKLLPAIKPRPDDAKLAVRAFGLNFPNPVGMAAGFDKNAEVPDALLRLGFGFVEIGSVTPRPQSGNPRPRLFRLERDEAVVNRMGFNNDGAEIVLRRLAGRANQGGIVGVNVGANKDSADRVADYVAGVTAAAHSYFQWAGPAFVFFGMGVSLYFSSQGAARVGGPVLASTARLLIVAIGGAGLMAAQAPAWSLFALVGGAMVVFGLSTAVSVAVVRWGK